MFFTLLTACKPKKDLPEGAPNYLKDKELWSAIKDKALDFEALEISGSGNYSGADTKLSFRFKLRVLKDSLIWVDLADPILGLKIVRGQLSREQVAYYNRLDRSYFKGNSAQLAQDAGFSFDFEPLMAILSANVLEWNMAWQQEYIPAFYALNNYPSDSTAPPVGDLSLVRQEVLNEQFRPHYLEVKRPTRGQILQVNYQNYQDFDGILYPGNISIRLVQSSENQISLDIKSVEKMTEPRFPFRIPDSYEQL